MRCFALERDRVRAFYTYQPLTRLQLLDMRAGIARLLGR
jgi:hypothetical protein